MSAAQLSSLLNDGRRMQRTPPRGRATHTFDDLVRQQARDAHAVDPSPRSIAGTPRSSRSDQERKAMAMRKIAEEVQPGFFDAAVASQVKSIHHKQLKRDAPSHGVRRHAKRSTKEKAAKHSSAKCKKGKHKVDSSSDGGSRVSDSSGSSSSGRSSSDSDTDAYSETRNRRLDRSFDPDRPPDTDEEEYYYTMSENQFRRWRERRDATKRERARRERRRRKKERAATEKRAKSAYIAQLTKMKMQGVPLSREYTVGDDLEDMRMEYERHQSCIAMIEKVETMRRTIGIVLTVAELILCALRLNVQGWASEVTKEMQNKKYDPILEKLYRKYWKRNAPSPEFSLALMIFGMMAMKWLENREARSREAQRAGGGAGGQPQAAAAAGASGARPGIGGAMSSVAQGVIGSLLGRGPGLLGSILGGLGGGLASSSSRASSPIPPPRTSSSTASPTSASAPPARATPASSPQNATMSPPSSLTSAALASSEPWNFARSRRGVAPGAGAAPAPGGGSGSGGIGGAVAGMEAYVPADRLVEPASLPQGFAVPFPALSARADRLAPSSQGLGLGAATAGGAGPTDRTGAGGGGDAVLNGARAMAAVAAERRRQQSLDQARQARLQMSDDRAADQALQRARIMSGEA